MKSKSKSTVVFPYLDYLRVMAVIGVVVIHSFDQWLFLPLTTLVQWVVPLYAMVSGALLISRPIESITEFYRKRFVRLGVPLVTWNLIFLAYGYITETTFNLKEALMRLIIFGQPLYFLFVLVGLYLVTPFLQRLLQSLSKKEQLLFSLSCLCLASIVSLTQNWLLAPHNILPLFSFNYFLYYLGFYLAGYLIHQEIIPPLSLAKTTVFYLASYLFTAGATYLFMAKFGAGPKGLIWFGHLSPSVVGMALSLFMAVKLLVKKYALTSTPAVSTLAKYSFGIYFTHMLIIEMVKPYLANYLLFMIALSFSILIVAILGRQKHLARLLGY
jgi:surface polysaccharide O-acyltransferase-like enzyme